jgi:quercetin dioxygenase-like cupin family protein
MNKPKPRRRIEWPGSSTVLAVGTTAILAAVIMAIRCRSRSTTYAQGERGESRGEGARGHRGDAIQSPLIGHEFRLFGDRFRMLESARETEDESLLAEYFAPPRAKVPEHVQADLEERFEVVSGTLRLRVGGRELILSSGQSAVGPPGVPHEWWNPSDDEEVHFLASIRPALDVETLLETWFGLARDEKTIWWIPKNPLQFAVMAHEVGGWFYFTGVRMPVWKAFFALLAPLAFAGKLLGYRARYPEYSGPEATEPMRIEESVEIAQEGDRQGRCSEESGEHPD